MQRLSCSLLRRRPVPGFNLRFAATVPGSNVPVQIPKEDLIDENSEFLQPVGIENLPRAQRRYAEQFEEINLIRTKEMFRKNYRNIFSLMLGLSIAVSIYVYTCVAVRQETFLEEIDQEMAEERGETAKS